MDLAERFWLKVNLPDSIDSDLCWNWNAGCYINGYGQIRDGAHKRLAHRVSYELHYGEVPAHLCVLHSCDNKKCVNPYHLFCGTHQENMDDKVNKERQPRGESHGMHKLTADQVREIRDRFCKGECVKARLGEEFGVSSVLIRLIVNRQIWRHI